VEDSAAQAAAYTAYLLEEPYRVDHVTSGEAALEYLEHTVPGLILLDLGLPGIDGLEVLRQLRQDNVASSVIIITDNDSVDIAVEAMRLGAEDYLAKPFDAERLRVTIQNATERQELLRLVESYRETIDRKSFHGMIGRSPQMQQVYETILKVGPTSASVFITGESGTGKELCADAIHVESRRKDQPLITLNCAAIPRELMESEIFGHQKGAFTGADQARDGAATRADGGLYFSMKSATWTSICRPSCCALFRLGRFRRWAVTRPSVSISGSSPRPTKTHWKRLPRAAFVRTCTIDCTSCLW